MKVRTMLRSVAFAAAGAVAFTSLASAHEQWVTTAPNYDVVYGGYGVIITEWSDATNSPEYAMTAEFNCRINRTVARFWQSDSVWSSTFDTHYQDACYTVINWYYWTNEVQARHYGSAGGGDVTHGHTREYCSSC